jgi:hypothetical protein
MASTQTQITGGNFQDFEGNPLSNGWLTMALSHDEQIASPSVQIVGGVVQKVPLDQGGNIQGTAYVWPNSAMLPGSSYYIVNAYREDGALAWKAPQYQTVSATSPFNVGSWIPNNPVPGGATPVPIILETNGDLNDNQALLNIEGQEGISVSNSAGTTVISASIIPNGANVADVPWNFWNRIAGSNLATAGFNYVQIMFANSILIFPESWTVSLYIQTALTGPIVEMCLIRTTKASLTTVDVTPITFGGSHTPTFSSTGFVTSDVINLAIDAQHDNYFCFAGNTFGGNGNLASCLVESENNVYAANPDTGGNALSSIWASSIGAGGGFNGAFPLGAPGEVGFFLAGWIAA